jgi:hypothetical protein
VNLLGRPNSSLRPSRVAPPLTGPHPSVGEHGQPPPVHVHQIPCAGSTLALLRSFLTSVNTTAAVGRESKSPPTITACAREPNDFDHHRPPSDHRRVHRNLPDLTDHLIGALPPPVTPVAPVSTPIIVLVK